VSCRLAPGVLSLVLLFVVPNCFVEVVVGGVDDVGDVGGVDDAGGAGVLAIVEDETV
jgi:hypothetical protein